MESIRKEEIMKEFNNRLKANKYAEYITGAELRKYVASKVTKYVGDDITVFDGACGSGQLEEYVNCSKVYGVEIQHEACEAFCENYPNGEVQCTSFFLHNGNEIAECTIMNPPFSLKYKDLSEVEKAEIAKDFKWKKSGVVDDIFILKGLKHSYRWGVFIVFPGIAYRKSEERMRQEIGNSLAELSLVRSGFVDTQINVLLLVIDKAKTSSKVYKEIFDCKKNKVIYSETSETEDDMWISPSEPIEKEVVDIKELEENIYQMKMKRRATEDELDKFINDVVKPAIGERK